MEIPCPYCGKPILLSERWIDKRGKRAGVGAYGVCPDCDIRFIIHTKEALQNVLNVLGGGKSQSVRLVKKVEKPVEIKTEIKQQEEQPLKEEQVGGFVPLW